MRIEDLDGPRVKADATRELLDDLAWLGLDWDGPVEMQSDDLEPYRAAVRSIVARGEHNVFHSTLSRRAINEAGPESAPNEGDHDSRFCPSLRPPVGDTAWTPNLGPLGTGRHEPEARLRLRVEPRSIDIHDAIAGDHVIDPAQDVGDFVIWTDRDLPSYQLAVVVDDIRGGVTDVVRGRDLLSSTARQTLLYELLGAPSPAWWHVGLVIGPDGRRLAKRHGDTRVRSYRDAGVSPERVLALMHRWCGGSRVDHMSAETFLQSFDARTLLPGDIVFQEEDHAWLLHT